MSVIMDRYYFECMCLVHLDVSLRVVGYKQICTHFILSAIAEPYQPAFCRNKEKHGPFKNTNFAVNGRM